MLMNRKASKINFRILANYVLIIGIVVGGLLFVNGVLQIKTYKDQAGDKTVEELTDEYNPLVRELGEVKKQLNDEYVQNGEDTEKYKELMKKRLELEEKTQPVYQSKYMKETGYHNPKSLSEYLTTAPSLIIGIIFLTAGIVAFIVLKKLDIEQARSERKTAQNDK